MDFDHHHYIQQAHHHYNHYKGEIKRHVTPYTDTLDIVDFAIVWTIILITIYWIFSKLGKVKEAIRLKGLYPALRDSFFDLAQKIPFVRRKIDEELSKSSREFQEEVARSRTDKITKIPKEGFSEEKIQSKMQTWTKKGEKLRDGMHMTGCQYTRQTDKVNDLVMEYSKNYLFSNPIHFKNCPDVTQMEAEVIAMTLDLYNGTEKCCGIITAGGSESILLAMLSYRERARERGIEEPEVILPDTAHPAFMKACWYFGIKPIIIPYNHQDGTVNVSKFKSAVNKNTSGAVVSVPNYANGAIDDIDEIGPFCMKKDIPIHVDCCLGGFLAPFAESCGRKLPIFDFRNPAVTTISCDHHKYGVSPKGVSVVMFNNSNLRQKCFFAMSTWPGGVYASSGLLGSRTGATGVGAWVTMVHHGYKGYHDKAKEIFDGQDKLVTELKKIPEVRVIGNPVLGTVSVVSNNKNLEILTILDLMNEKGWTLNSCQRPNAIQFLLNYCNVRYVDQMLKDFRECLATVLKDPSKFGENKFARLYATTAKLPPALSGEGCKLAIGSFLNI